MGSYLLISSNKIDIVWDIKIYTMEAKIQMKNLNKTVK